MSNNDTGADTAAAAEAAAEAGALINQTFGLLVSMTALRSVFEMGIIEKLPVDRSLAAQEWASASGADPDLLIRLLRPLTSAGIFEEVSPTTYRHTPMSLAFRDHRLRAYMQLGWDMWMPVYSSLHTWLKNNNFRLSSDPKKTPFTSIYQDGLFEFLSKNPAHASVFNDSMEHMAYSSAHFFPLPSRIADAAKRDSSQKPVFVDIGGGKGQAAREITTEYPELDCRIILQDQRTVLDEVPADLKSKLVLMPYNFFQPQPIKGAAFYYLRNIMCDWPDAKCLEILRNQVSAMSKSSVLLLTTRVIPASGVDPVTAAMDLSMLTYGGAERTEEHYRRILIDAGLEVVKFWTEEDAQWGIFEARLGSGIPKVKL